MTEAMREFAIARTRKLLRAYTRKIEEAKMYLEYIPRVGREIVENYDNNVGGQRTLLLKACESEDFFSGMSDEMVLAYADVCNEMNALFDLNVEHSHSIKSLSAGENGVDNLREVADFVKNQIDDFGERVFGKGKVFTASNNVQKLLVEQIKKDITILEDKEHPHNYTRHGNFGEMAVDVDLEGTGHIKRISMSRVESLDAPMRHGIDGIYENLTPPPKYIILDSKYLSSEASKTDTFAPTMSTSQKTKITQLDDNWILNNLREQFTDANGMISSENKIKMREIENMIKSNDKNLIRCGGKVDSSGKVTYYKYGNDGKVLKDSKIINEKEKNIPLIWNKGD